MQPLTPKDVLKLVGAMARWRPCADSLLATYALTENTRTALRDQIALTLAAYSTAGVEMSVAIRAVKRAADLHCGGLRWENSIATADSEVAAAMIRDHMAREWPSSDAVGT